jgi:Protein of unknown function (DUF2605)
MATSNSQESELLKAILEPLLDDFQYWFGRSQTLLEEHPLDFLGEIQQADLLRRVCEANREVAVAKSLLALTDGQVGIDSAILAPWHRLVTECWQASARFRSEQTHI